MTRREYSRPGEQRLAYVLVLPAVAIALVALGYPLVRQFIMSMQKFGLEQQFGQAPSFIGLKNFETVLTDPDFWHALVRSLVFCLVAAAATMIIGTLGGLLLTRVSRAIAVGVQTVMVVAWAMPVLSSLEVFQWLFNQRSGLVNWLLQSVGFVHMNGYNWLAQPHTFFLVAGGLVTWMSVPLVVIMVYASVTQIDESVLEAAQIDGSGGWNTFRHIIAPSIAPILTLVSLLEVIWDLKVFTQVHVLQGSSGITSHTNVLGTYVYQVGLAGGNYGLASAAAIIMLALTLVLCWRYLQSLLKGSTL